MKTYIVCGNLEVAGIQPGSRVTEKELGEANVDGLIQAGHITLLVTSKETVDAVKPDEEQ